MTYSFMTREKAIEILTICADEGSLYPTKDRQDAIKLAIADMKYIQRRKLPGPDPRD